MCMFRYNTRTTDSAACCMKFFWVLASDLLVIFLALVQTQKDVPQELTLELGELMVYISRPSPNSVLVTVCLLLL